MSILSEKFLEYIRPTDLLLKLIWLVELASMGIYVFIAYVAARNAGDALNPEFSAMLVFIFTALSIILLLFAVIFHSLFLTDRAVAKFADDKMSGWMRMIIGQSSAGIKDEKLASLPEKERNFYIYSRSAFKLFAFFYGLINSCALFGMILAIITKRPILIFPFVALSTLLILSYFPNLRKLIESARTLDGYRAN